METAATFLVFSFLHVCSSVPVSHPTNWLRQCRASTNLSITALEVLPGGGWDNLRNMDMGRVMNLSYSQCQTTEDGLYLIPDEVFVIPQKETGVETSSEIIRSWLEQKSSTSESINADMSFLKLLNGKFSSENKRMKTHQVKDSSTTARVQVRNFLYTVKAYPGFTLDTRFVQQVRDIAEAIENNQTKNADYLSEMMVLDYGTHVITTVDAGAALVQEDYLRSSYVSDSESQSSSVKAQAGLNFFDKLKFDISSQSAQQSSSLQTYQSNIQYSLIQSHGGTTFYPGITLQKWQESTRNNLVAIDRSGFPLHYFINTNTLTDLPHPTIRKVALKVSQAVERYYKINTRPGCVDVNSKNFNFQANMDDNSLPPFTKPPLISMQATNTVMVMTEGENSWVRVGQTKKWKLAKPEEIKEFIQNLHPKLNQMSSGEKAGVAFGVIGMILLVAIVAVFLVKRRRRMSGFRTMRGYEKIPEEAEMDTQQDVIRT
ncbi:macrophage-expressed gene 1 protein-like [Pundamilia nyererei]|uniref:Macrophage-expressed gene 1 protein n=1 Tax=Pundamilia nyererei TaxID=303518 RepID=A0A9Y3QN44_9CICH|nr:PREDICTED: macrophage-expressed gene 1 protein-like [Pundamilia nyererei]